MTNSPIEDFAVVAGAVAGLVAVEFGLACARAWLLSLVVALVAPAIVLTFWQWFLVVVTIRFIFSNLDSSKK
jgi:lysylphosphatidylglycerol synthetase-like protein (DUF2156 family)